VTCCIALYWLDPCRMKLLIHYLPECDVVTGPLEVLLTGVSIIGKIADVLSKSGVGTVQFRSSETSP